MVFHESTEPQMTPPTLHELAGIFMLALATTILITHPSAGSNDRVAIDISRFENLTPSTIDGIENVSLPRP
jgi:hypothetical protein